MTERIIIFALEKSKIFLSFYEDIIIFISNPKKYFNKILNEPIKKSTYRFFTYILFFTILETISLCFSFRDRILGNLSGTLAVIPYELAIALIKAFALIPAAFLLHTNNKTRTILSYTISFHYIYLLPIVILSGLFFITESYLFAMLRGWLMIVFVFMFFVMFPILFSTNTSRQIIKVILSALLGISLSILVSFLIYKTTPNTENLRYGTYMYDPIAYEFESMKKEYNLYSANLLSNHIDKMNNAFKLAAKKMDNNYYSIDLREFSSAIEDWNKDRQKTINNIVSMNYVIDNFCPKFSTNKKMLVLLREKNSAYGKAVTTFDIASHKRFFGDNEYNFSSSLKYYIEYLKTGNKFADEYIRLMKLRRWSLVTY